MLRKLSISVLLAGIGIAINRIKYDPLKNWFKAMKAPLKEIADVMTDKDPDNAEQMREVWEQHGEIITNRSVFALKTIAGDKIKNPEVLEYVLDTLEIIQDTINNPDDEIPLSIQAG